MLWISSGYEGRNLKNHSAHTLGSETWIHVCLTESFFEYLGFKNSFLRVLTANQILTVLSQTVDLSL